MRNKIIILTGFCLLFACASPSIEKPENLLSKSKMTEILTDILIYQQTRDVRLEDVSSNINFTEVNLQILKKHGVELTDFRESYEYYSLMPDVFNKILDNVEGNLEAMKPEVE